ncbi:cytochrome P450 [Sphaerisporangium krabiense]|uniref:Cytochrome P450 n=2 Tax=Sphaerisporangium krabiense TaxID=763782 RepID=A0A7W8Z7S5_9ACTN|nr:cytochrome P450 [Sphaerisporangium krabiense]
MIVRLPAGSPSLYLVSHPDHVQHVLRGNWENYQRDGMLWRPVRRLLGQSILSDGASWEASRRIMQPLLTARKVASLAEEMARTVNERVGELEGYAVSGRTFDAAEELADLVNQTVIKVLFGGRLSRAAGHRLSLAYDRATRAIAFRLLMPSMPYSLRLPGDRTFMAAVKTIDEEILPMIRQGCPHAPGDVFSALYQARAERGEGERQIRDDIVNMYSAAAETTATALTWLWPTLDAHPDVADRLRAEVDQVVGDGPVRASHLPELTYTSMVLRELMRLSPAAWLFPRVAENADRIDGVPIEAGAQVLISPYATHRLDGFWDRPLEFDPERFAPGAAERRHRYAYFPFGGGPHLCLGKPLFEMAAPLIIAAILSRFRPTVRGGRPITPLPAATLRPRQKVELTLVHARREAA